MRRLGPLAVAMVATVVWVVGATAQGTVYRSRSDLVSLFATVTDAGDGFVDALPKDAFEVYDNGKRQTVSLFSREIQPISVVVLLDRSGSMAEDADRVRDAAAEFIKRLLPNDRARIGQFSDEIDIEPSDFTSDQAVLMKVLGQDPPPLGSSPIWTATDRAVTALLREGGRRVILLLSDGHDNPLREQIHTDVKDVIYRAEYDEVMLYTIGLSGEEWLMSGGRLGSGGRHGSWRGGGMAISSKTEPPDPNLKKLADESGGRYFLLEPTVDLGSLFARIADELHHQYWLGFTPTKLDEKVHKLEVKLTRPGLTVRARQSYVAR